jgi:hypothetical protein
MFCAMENETPLHGEGEQSTKLGGPCPNWAQPPAFCTLEKDFSELVPGFPDELPPEFPPVLLEPLPEFPPELLEPLPELVPELLEPLPEFPPELLEPLPVFPLPLLEFEALVPESFPEPEFTAERLEPPPHPFRKRTKNGRHRKVVICKATRRAHTCIRSEKQKNITDLSFGIEETPEENPGLTVVI